jgi:CubicO group peptidase (beta-lactamase class C family)
MRYAFVGRDGVPALAWRFSCLALAALSLLSCATEPRRDERFARLDAMLETQARDLPLPGVSAALMVRGELVWTGVQGWADTEARIPVTPDTPFNIASLTKPMTGVVLMQMVENGQLSLDTPMQRYDPSFTDPRITVGHVLSMRSESDPPGEAYAYNGNPFGMLNTVMTGAAGETLAQAYSTRIIEPLGLQQTSPGSLAGDSQGLSAERVAHYESVMAREAVATNMYGGVEPIATFPVDPAPNAAANVVSTASDYARFADAVMRGRFLNQATLDAMWTLPVNSRGEQLGYAYGWFSEEYQGHRVIYHYGYYPNAWSAVMMIVPERELVFVALSNGHGLNAGNGIGPIEGHVMACAVLREFVDAAAPCAEAAQANATRWRAQLPAAEPEVAIDPAQLPRYAGTYRRPSGLPVQVVVADGRLWWQNESGRYALTHVGPDRFVRKTDNQVNTFVFDEAGRATHINVTNPAYAETYVLPRLD